MHPSNTNSQRSNTSMGGSFGPYILGPTWLVNGPPAHRHCASKNAGRPRPPLALGSAWAPHRLRQPPRRGFAGIHLGRRRLGEAALQSEWFGIPWSVAPASNNLGINVFGPLDQFATCFPSHGMSLVLVSPEVKKWRRLRKITQSLQPRRAEHLTC